MKDPVGVESAVSLQALPFTASELKMLQQQSTEVAKGLRTLVPKAKAKAKSAGKSPAGSCAPSAGDKTSDEANVEGAAENDGAAGSVASAEDAPRVSASLKRPAAKVEAVAKRRRSKGA